LNSFYSKALNLNRVPAQNEQPILNPFQKKLGIITEKPILKKLSGSGSNNLIKNSEREQSPPKCPEEKNPEKKEKMSPSLKNYYFNNSQKSFNDESQNIVNIIKHLSMVDYPQNYQKTNILTEIAQSNDFSNNLISFEEFQKVQYFSIFSDQYELIYSSSTIRNQMM